MKGELKSQLKLDARGSQTVITIFAVSSGLLLTAGMYFLWHDRESWYIPTLVGLVGFALSYWMWHISHHRQDWERPPPTKISFGPEGELNIEFSNEPISSHGKSLIEKALEHVATHRQLPIPDGKIDNNGKPEPSKVNEVLQQIIAANTNIEQFRTSAKQTLKTTEPTEGKNQADLENQ